MFPTNQHENIHIQLRNDFRKLLVTKMVDHNFIGTWEIIKSTFDGKVEKSGLENVKFRLDETGDISWYNDLSSLSQPKDCYDCCDSASVLFSCETFDVNEENPRLIFGAFAGHSIEFNTSSLNPTDVLKLECENWYTLYCKKLKDEQAGQEKEFTFSNALKESYFSDVKIKSQDGMEFAVHSTILRLNGFDCSMCSSPSLTKNEESSISNESINIKISITSNANLNNNRKKISQIDLSPTYLQLPKTEKFIANKNNLSSSFNSLDVLYKKNSEKELLHHANSSSESNLQTNLISKTIFTFSNELCGTRKPPLSPYKIRSPSPFPSTTDTPPSSPLTPVGILNDLPSFLLTVIINWLYTESLPCDLSEENCEQIINFSETQPSLFKIVEPCKKYLKLIRLKKFVLDTVMDLTTILNKIISQINLCSTNHQSTYILKTFKECLKDASIGFGRILVFCKVFVTDGSDISRNQRNDIIKYIRGKISSFIAQMRKLLDTISKLLISLTLEEKSILINSLIPEIEYHFDVLTKLIHKFKKSLDKICTDMKCSSQGSVTEGEYNSNGKSNNIKNNANLFLKFKNSVYGIPSQSMNIQADNDLKLLLYMYEVRKLHDIYGRISMILDILREKRFSFCEMDMLDKISTIDRNFEQLLLDIPTYIQILENLSDKFDDNIGWKEFKFCFKLATSQINEVITKLIEHKPALKSVINQICNFFGHEEFTKCLIDLGLLPENNFIENKMHQISEKKKYEYRCSNLHLVKGLCYPPTAANSSLAKAALRLLHSGQGTDMVFEIIQNRKDAFDQNKCVKTLRAHRIIVASRCEWFKKALMSGMVESITHKIVIRDTSPIIFRRLLLYLYGAPVDKTVGAEQICELMLLADRYSIDDLKGLCENALNSLIDENSVVCLLGIADRYLASKLKSRCLSFLSQNPRLTKQDIFKELSNQVQQEVQDLILWYGRIPEPWSERSPSYLRSSSKTFSASRKPSASITPDIRK